jgi:hypothetical protein
MCQSVKFYGRKLEQVSESQHIFATT